MTQSVTPQPWGPHEVPSLSDRARHDVLVTRSLDKALRKEVTAQNRAAAPEDRTGDFVGTGVRAQVTGERKLLELKQVSTLKDFLARFSKPTKQGR